MPKQTAHKPAQKKVPSSHIASSRLTKILKSPRFSIIYLVFSVMVLVGSVVYWSLLGAKVNLSNADALSDSYLFKNFATFHGAVFPGAHTFLLKWPLFLLIRLLGFSDSAFISLTVLVVLATVLGLVLILSRIERRRLVLATLCLALASVLVIIPAQPYAGALLPLNMAMLATRNIEYLFYLVSLVLIARSPRLKSRSFWLATSCLTLLIASDKLFLTIGLGAAAIALTVYSLTRMWDMVTVSVHWLLAEAIAAVGAVCLLGLITASHLTHIDNLAGTGPYGLSNLHGLILGGLYVVLSLFTNLGANPAYDATIVRNLPHTAIDKLLGVGGLSFIVNLVLAIIGFYIVGRIVYSNLFSRSAKPAKVAVSTRLALMLAWTTLVAVVLFVVSDHYYAVDARYLTVVLFAVFVGAAVFTRGRSWRPERLLGLGLVLVLSTALGLVAARHSYNSEQAALAPINKRNSSVAAIIKAHPTDVLVGDYWRVMPILQASRSKLSVLPLADCTQPLTELSSSNWQINLNKHSFTYLLSYGRQLTSSTSCSLKEVVSYYGRPNASVLVAGSPTAPKEQLLFYDYGIHKRAPTRPQPAQGPSTVVPITLDELPNATCLGPSIMAVVAHQDDDLLFMNPDLLHAIKAGYCVHTVYITAGDDGQGQFYWLSRERGSEAAYSVMTGQKSIWINRTVQLANNEFASVANPKGNSKISLIFLHLPDGNLKGQGFSATGFQSLAKLYAHQINTIHSVDGLSTYSYTQLVDALSNLMGTFSPTEIYTQSTYPGKQFPDHSDHNTVGQFMTLAYAQYEKNHYNDSVNIPIHFYIGYPIHAMPPNVSGADLKAKEAVFLAYAKYDGDVCSTILICDQTPTYAAYLTREYQNPF